MENLKFDIATAREKYLESTMVGREYMQKRILSMEDGSYTMAHDLREYDHQVITRTVFNKLPKELVKWYKTDNLENWSRIVDPKKPRIDFEKKEINLLTLRTVKPISEYKKKTKAGAQIVLDFFRDIIANENEGVYEYLLNWIANSAQGNKNTAAIYLKQEVEGIGKSTFVDCVKAIIGGDVCQKGSVSLLKTEYNKSLAKMLVCYFEELQSFSTSEWMGVSSVLKDLVTSDHLRYSEKYEKGFEAKNYTSVIIPTNNESIKDSHGRRWMCLDISLKRKGDSKYFGAIYDQLKKQDVVDYLLAMFQKRDVSKFVPQKFPTTHAKNDAIADRLATEYQFLKDEYVLQNKDLKVKVLALYQEYQQYCDRTEHKAVTKVKFTRLLSNIGVDHVRHAKGYVYNLEADRVVKIFKTNNFIHDLDEFPSDDNADEGVDYHDDIEDKANAVRVLRKRNENLEKQVADLQKQLDEFKAALNYKKRDNAKPLPDDLVDEIEELEITDSEGRRRDPEGNQDKEKQEETSHQSDSDRLERQPQLLFRKQSIFYNCTILFLETVQRGLVRLENHITNTEHFWRPADVCRPEPL
jgi:Family of unknown function (DUF5906)